MQTTAITTNILQRTFLLTCGGRSGTCFTVDVDNRQYIVTAKHLVDSIADEAVVKISRDTDGKPFDADLDVRLVGHGAEGIDVSVLTTEHQLSLAHPLLLMAKEVALSDDVYFLGFPYGLTNRSGSLNNDFPFVLIKK